VECLLLLRQNLQHRTLLLWMEDPFVTSEMEIPRIRPISISYPMVGSIVFRIIQPLRMYNALCDLRSDSLLYHRTIHVLRFCG